MEAANSAKLQNTPQLWSASLTCVGRLWRSRHNTIDAILIQWHLNELRGILKLLRKFLKLLCDVWKEVIFRMQKIVRVLSRDCLGDRWRWCYFWRMQVACRRVQKNWIVYFYRVIAISSYRWSFEVLAFL